MEKLGRAIGTAGIAFNDASTAIMKARDFVSVRKPLDVTRSADELPRLSLQALSERSGVSPADIKRYAGRSLIAKPSAEGTYDGGDLIRLRLINALLDSGITEEALETAVSSGLVSFGFAGQMLADPVSMSRMTVAEVCSKAGIDHHEFTELMLAIGFAPHPADAVLRDDMREFVGIYVSAVELGVPAEVMMQTLQSFAMSMRRIAEASRALVREHVETPLLREGLGRNDMLATAAPIRRSLQQIGFRAAFLLQRRMYEEVLFSNVMARFEEALQRHDVAGEGSFTRRAVCFIDLSGFTKSTETTGDASAAVVGSRLLRIVQHEVSLSGGDLVKALGDGAMMMFRHPEEAIVTACRILVATRAAGLPTARGGVSAGSVISQDGDFYGRAVNRASRLLGIAEPGQVVVSSEVPAMVNDETIRFVALGKVSLKGMTDEVGIFAATVVG